VKRKAEQDLRFVPQPNKGWELVVATRFILLEIRKLGTEITPFDHL